MGPVTLMGFVKRLIGWPAVFALAIAMVGGGVSRAQDAAPAGQQSGPPDPSLELRPPPKPPSLVSEGKIKLDVVADDAAGSRLSGCSHGISRFSITARLAR